MTGPPDPRVYFAAERTLLAWLRTSIAIMAFGFVIARFGLIVRLLQVESGELTGSHLSLYLGAALVVLGIAAAVGGALEFRSHQGRLPPGDLPSRHATAFPSALAWALVVAGLVLILILLR